MPKVSLNIKGLSAFEDDAEWLETGQHRFLQKITDRIADAVKEASPKGRIPFRGHVTSSTLAKIESNHPGAKALDKGAYIRGHGKKLRFHVEGRTIFTKAVRIKGTKYVAKGLRKRNKIVTEEYERIFGGGVHGG
jgi:hypothetical protein